MKMKKNKSAPILNLIEKVDLIKKSDVKLIKVSKYFFFKNNHSFIDVNIIPFYKNISREFNYVQ
jgi:hypothetical protein